MVLMYSFVSAPRRLVALLRTGYGAESGKAGHSKMYQRIYGILWVSCVPFATKFAIAS